MKKQAYTMIGALVFGSLFAVSTARGQSTNQPLIAHIPFAFTVGGQTLPAGEYKLSLLSPASNQNTIRIARLDGAATVVARTLPEQSHGAEGRKLVFHRYGDRYFFAQALSFDGAAREIPESRTERDLKRELGANQKEIETVVLETR
jgi:hypothetical protein